MRRYSRWKSCHDSHVKWPYETQSCLAGWTRRGESALQVHCGVVSGEKTGLTRAELGTHLLH